MILVMCACAEGFGCYGTAYVCAAPFFIFSLFCVGREISLEEAGAVYI